MSAGAVKYHQEFRSLSIMCFKMWSWIFAFVLVQQFLYINTEEDIETTENTRTVTYVDVLENEIAADQTKTSTTPQHLQLFSERSNERRMLNSVFGESVRCDQGENCETQISTSSLPEVITQTSHNTQTTVSNEIQSRMPSKTKTQVSMQTFHFTEKETPVTEESSTPALREIPVSTQTEIFVSTETHSPTNGANMDTHEAETTVSNSRDTRTYNLVARNNITWSLVNIPENTSSQYTTIEGVQIEGYHLGNKSSTNSQINIPESTITGQNLDSETYSTTNSLYEIRTVSTQQITNLNSLENLQTDLMLQSQIQNITSETNDSLIFNEEENSSISTENSSVEEVTSYLNSNQTFDALHSVTVGGINFSTTENTPSLENGLSDTSLIENTTRLPKSAFIATALNFEMEATESFPPTMLASTQEEEVISSEVKISTATNSEDTVSEATTKKEFSPSDNFTTISSTPTENYAASDTNTVDTNNYASSTNTGEEMTSPTIYTMSTLYESDRETHTSTIAPETSNSIDASKTNLNTNIPNASLELQTTISFSNPSTSEVLYTQQPHFFNVSNNNEVVLSSTHQTAFETTLDTSTVTDISQTAIHNSSPVVTNPHSDMESTNLISTSEKYFDNETTLSSFAESTLDHISMSDNPSITEMKPTVAEIEHITTTIIGETSESYQNNAEVTTNGSEIKYSRTEINNVTESETILESTTEVEVKSSDGTYSFSDSVTQFSESFLSTSSLEEHTTSDSQTWTETSDKETTLPAESVEIVTSEYLTTTSIQREGKNIPINNSVHPFIQSTDSTFLTDVFSFNTEQEDITTMKKKSEIFITQVRPEDISQNEKANIITAIIQLSEMNYTQELLDQKTVAFHLWLLHAIIQGSLNYSMNSSENGIQGRDGVAFENLPTVVYIIPTPVFNGSNLTFSFVAHNFWNNETFSADILLKILKIHSIQLHLTMNTSMTLFLKGLLADTYTRDWWEVIIDKYGIVILTTCLIAVGLIVLLILAVVHYRIRHRQSVHCITDVDKLHRNIQEAIGIDLNPAIVILQDEISEKTILSNGDKICAVDDDEGWLVPITDVPMLEDSNAASVQDTKL